MFATLDLLIRILGGVVGNMALKIFATGGLHRGGGIPARILPPPQKKDFLDAISGHGHRFGRMAANPLASRDVVKTSLST